MPANITSRNFILSFVRSSVPARAYLASSRVCRAERTNDVITHDPFAFFVRAESSVAHAPRASDTDVAGVPQETFRVTFRDLSGS